MFRFVTDIDEAVNHATITTVEKALDHRDLAELGAVLGAIPTPQVIDVSSGSTGKRRVDASGLLVYFLIARAVLGI